MTTTDENPVAITVDWYELVKHCSTANVSIIYII